MSEQTYEYKLIWDEENNKWQKLSKAQQDFIDAQEKGFRIGSPIGNVLYDLSTGRPVGEEAPKKTKLCCDIQ